MSEPTCWILTEGMIGTQNQCIALAEACGIFQPIVKKVKLKAPWRQVTPYIRHFTPAALTADSATLDGPWPDLIIASGRKAIAPALWIKRQSGNRAVLVIVQSPIIKDRQFDLVLPLRHDDYQAPNSLPITGALSYLTADKIAAAGAAFPQFAELPSPRIAVMIGGNSRTHQLTSDVAQRLTAQLRDLAQQGYSLMITASRRTPDDLAAMMRDALSSLPHVFFWDGTGASPYTAFLAHADVILVTEDSVSMASEALSTGKPTYIVPLEGGSKRFKRFHDHLIDSGYARWFKGIIESWAYTPPNDLIEAASRVKILLQEKQKIAP